MKTTLDNRIGTCFDVAVGGLGVVRLEPSGQIAMTENALSGERVEIVNVRKQRGTLFGQVARHLSTSPQRVAPACAWVDPCGGCTLMHASIKHQHAIKQSWLDIEGRLPEWRLTAKQVARQRARFHWAPVKNGRVQLGYRASQSHKIIGVDNCIALGDPLQHAFQEFRASLPSQLQGEGTIVITSNADGAVYASFMSSAHQRSEVYRMLEAYVDTSRLEGIALRFGGTTVAHRYGESHLTTRAFGHTLRAPLDGFVQANAEVNDLMIETLVECFKHIDAESVLELYAGFGNLSVPLIASISSKLKSYTLVESNEESVIAARHNLQRFEKEVPRLKIVQGDAQNTEIHHDVVVLDPPREGAKRVATAIAQMPPKKAPRHIFYISCHPSTLKRDLALLRRSYHLENFYAFDMFPNTGHVEALVHLVAENANTSKTSL